MGDEATELSAEAILAARDIVIERVETPKWGGCLYVRTLGGRQRDQWENYCQARRDADGKLDVEGVMASLLVRCVCDSRGKLLFKPNQADELNKKAAPVLMRLYRIALRVNALGPDDIETLAGN